MNTKWLLIITGAALLLGILNFWPYDYYTILRWLVCISAIVSVIGFSRSKLAGWMLVFGAVAILFNPLFPIYMNKSSWVGIDLIGSILFFLAAFSIKKNTKDE